MKYMEPKIAIITLNWNGKEYLDNFLKSVFNQNYENYNIIVIDNGSLDNSIGYIKENFPEVILVENNKNLGYSKGINIGLRKAMTFNPDYILITNNDLILDSNILKEGVNLAKTDEKIGYISGKVYDITERNRFQIAGGRLSSRINRGAGEIDTGQYEKVEDFEYMDDVFALVNVKMISEVGYYDEDFFFDYEETEWNYRIRKHGYRIVYNPKMRVWHRLHGSTKGDRYVPHIEFYTWRGKILFNYKVENSWNFLFFSLSLFFKNLPIHYGVLVKRSKSSLIATNFLGILSAYKRIIELKSN